MILSKSTSFKTTVIIIAKRRLALRFPLEWWSGVVWIVREKTSMINFRVEEISRYSRFFFISRGFIFAGI